MTKPKSDKIGCCESELQKAEKRGMHGLPPDEHELSSIEADILNLEGKIHSVDDLPEDYAKKAIPLLNLKETPEILSLIWEFLKDEISWRLHPTQHKYPRLRQVRSMCSKEVYSNFYNVLSKHVPDLPRPAEDKVIHLTIPKS